VDDGSSRRRRGRGQVIAVERVGLRQRAVGKREVLYFTSFSVSPENQSRLLFCTLGEKKIWCSIFIVFVNYCLTIN